MSTNSKSLWARHKAMRCTQMCITKFATIRMTPSMHLKVTLLRWSDWPPALSAKLLKSNLQAPSTHTARPSVRDQPPRCEAAEGLNSYHQCAFCPPACALLANWMHAGLVPLLGLQRPHKLDAVRTNRVLTVTVNVCAAQALVMGPICAARRHLRHHHHCHPDHAPLCCLHQPLQTAAPAAGRRAASWARSCALVHLQSGRCHAR